MAEADIEQLGDLVKELAAVQDELLALDDDAFARRHELLKRQDELREQVAGLQVDPDVGRSRADLEAELEALRERLEAIRAQRIDPVVQAGGGDSGWGNIGASQINRGIVDAQGGEAIKERIAQIEQRLGVLDGGLPDGSPDRG